MAHTISCTRGGITLLLSALAQPGWTKATASLYRAGKILEELEMKFNEEAPKDLTEQKEWAIKIVSFESSEKERDVLKECLTHHVKEGHIGPSRHFRALADTLGIAPSNEE
jgi:hypothetical protein